MFLLLGLFAVSQRFVSFIELLIVTVKLSAFFEDSYCYEFIADVIRVIDDIFYKFNLNRIEFQCFAMNPVCDAYRGFIKKYGGREVATLRQTTKLMDGMFHDSILFEILFDDLTYPSDEEVFDKFGDIKEIYSKLHYDRLRIDRMMNRGI